MKQFLFVVVLIIVQVSPLQCSTVHPYYVGLQMGKGAEVITNQFFGYALQNFSTNTQQHGQQSQWKFRSVDSSRELIEQLGVDIAGAFSTWYPHSSPVAQFVQDIGVNKYSTNLLLKLVIEVSEENIVRPQLSEEAENYVEDYGLAEFYNVYGREYLSGTVYGGIFLGLITIHTLSVSEKQAILEGLQFSGWGTELTPKISTEAQKILENRRVEASTTQIIGQPQPIISNFDEMINQLKQFPDLVTDYPVPIYGIFNEYKKSIAYPWHDTGDANDCPDLEDNLYELSIQATNLKDRKSNLEYVQQYYDIFEEFQLGNESDSTEYFEEKSYVLEEISDEIDFINSEILKINRASNFCVLNTQNCSVPEILYEPIFELPEQQYGDVVLKADEIVEEMFLQAQKELTDLLSSANSQIQQNISNSNLNLEQAVSNATANFNNLLLQAQASAENMNSQVQSKIDNNNLNLEQVVSNATTSFNNLLSQAQETAENMNSQVQSNININNQNLEYAVSNATKNIEDMFFVNTAMIYYGDINDIPPGWQLCDGSNLNGITIPDLRGRFPLGENYDEFDDENRVFNATPVGKIGGDFQKFLTEDELPAHMHNMQNSGIHNHSFDDYYFADHNCQIWPRDVFGSGSRTDSDNKYCSVTHDTETSGDHTHVIDSAGQSQPFDIVPPYAVVYFICRIE